jgi:hypothetical protein
MKKTVLFPLILVFVFLQLSTFSVWAAEESLSPANPERSQSLVWGQPSNIVDIGLGYLFFSGSASWEISFRDQNGRGRSVLDFKNITGDMPFISLDLRHPNSYVSLSFQYGKSQNLDGDGTDSDYLSRDLAYRSRFDLSGETSFWNADIQTAYSFISQPRWVFMPFLGWQHFERNLRLSDGFWTVFQNQDTNSPIDGLDSRYDFNWDALRVGLKADLDLAKIRQSGNPPLKLKTYLALFPYMHYKGRGVWNLRDDLRQDPSFTHEADNFGVLGMDGAVSLVYRPLKYLEIEGGGRISYFYMQDGKDTTYFSNNTVVDTDLEEVKTLQVGLFLKITGRF